MQLQHLFIYPIKALGGIALTKTVVQKRGLQYDRRYMLVDDDGKFLTQRQLPKMALLKVKMDDNCFKIEAVGELGNGTITLKYATERGDVIHAQIWSDVVDTIHVSKVYDDFFSNILNLSCRLVYMPDNSERPVNAKFAKAGDITSFTDGYPILLVGNQSLSDLNSRLQKSLDWDRFRPNLVVKTQVAFVEDAWTGFAIGDAKFEVVKPCSRCVVTTIDQHTSIASKEPLKTLATYRMQGNHVNFGQNVIPRNNGGLIRVGDEVVLI